MALLLPRLRQATLSGITRPTCAAHARMGIRFNSSANTGTAEQLPAGTSKDPQHPNLYYHLTPPPPSEPRRIALSFLARPPAASDSRTVLGYLPLTADAGINDFEENAAFRPVLDAAVRDALEKRVDEVVENDAATRPGDGFMHIVDERNTPMPGRVGEPEDLVGSVFVENGAVVPSTYEPMPTYRLVTTNGVMTLHSGLAKHLVSALEKIDAEERA